MPERVGEQVLGHGSGQRVGDHQRRRRQIVGARLRVDAALEVAVAGQHRRHRQAALVDGLADGLRQRPGVADAGGAAVAHKVEAEGVQLALQAGGLQIVRHHLRSRCQRRLDPRLDREPQSVGVARQQPGGHQHAGVRRIGATGDGGDDDIAVPEAVVGSRHRHRAVQAGNAAAALFVHVGGGAGVVDGAFGTQKGLERRGRLGQRHPVLGPLGPGQRRLHRVQVQFDGVGEHRVGGRGVAPQPLGLGVGLHQRDPVGIAAGEGEIVDGGAADGEEAAGGAVLGRHVGDGGLIGQRQVVEAVAVELHELAHHALGAQHLGHGQHQVGGGGALLHPAGELHAHHLRDQHGDGLAEHGRLGLDAAHAPAQNRQAVDHGGVAVRAHHGIGVGHGGAVFAERPDHLRQVFQVHLMADAGSRRHHAEVVERLLPPAQEFIALAVALELHLHVLLERRRRAELVHHHRVVDDQVHGHLRVDLRRIGAERHHGVAHGREVDHGRNAGEVLHQHPGRPVGDLALRRAGLQPSADRLDVVDVDGAVVLPAQQVLQQNLERERQGRDVAERLGGGLQAVVVVAVVADGEGAAGVQGVMAKLGHEFSPPGGRDCTDSQAHFAEPVQSRNERWGAAGLCARSDLCEYP